MNDVMILPFRREHLDLIELQEHEKQVLDFDSFSARMENVALTYIYKGVILCVYGWYTLWPGVVEIFILPSIYFLSYPKKVIQLAKLEFDKVKAIDGIHRIQSMSWDSEDRTNFMIHFGFKCEGMLRRYTSRQHDYRIWSMVRNTGEPWDS